MRIDRRHPARLDGERLEVAVVIDVLRATSTAAILAARGASALAVVATPGELGRLPPGRYLMVSELAELREGSVDRIDNSPVRALTFDLAGRTPVLVTTNGTRALHAAAACADRVLLGSFLGASATVRAIERLAPERVTLLPCGNFERKSAHAEDELCADGLAALLAGSSPDLAAVAALARADARVLARIAREPGFEDDVALALTPDRCPVALAFELDADGIGWVRPCAAG